MTKLAMLAAGAMALLGADYAMAGGGQTMESGRPSAVLTPERCTEIWAVAVPEGEVLVEAKAGPHVVNFAQIDTDANGSISKAEFDAACAKGMIKDTGQGQ